ncbi:MAG: glycosyltransferase family 4 protein, partial [Chthonomonadales bacterium]
KADLADYAVVDGCTHPLVKLARKAGKDAALAAYGFTKRKEYDAIFSNGENVSIPLATLFKFVMLRPAHILIGHHLSTPKKRWFLTFLRSQMDLIFVYAETQRQYAVDRLKMLPKKLRLIPFHADALFYHPMDVKMPELKVISSAGLEWRDYPTMMEALKDTPAQVKLAAASPWSKHKNETETRTLPQNVSARRYSYRELRDLYAESSVVVVPLYDNDFQAGVTTLLEAMAMGKPVVITRTIGQRDVILDGVNGIYVPPSDPIALREAVDRLLADEAGATRMGEEARKVIELEMSLDRWVERLADGINEVVQERSASAH